MLTPLLTISLPSGPTGPPTPSLDVSSIGCTFLLHGRHVAGVVGGPVGSLGAIAILPIHDHQEDR